MLRRIDCFSKLNHRQAPDFYILSWNFNFVGLLFTRAVLWILCILDYAFNYKQLFKEIKTPIKTELHFTFENIIDLCEKLFYAKCGPVS